MSKIDWALKSIPGDSSATAQQLGVPLGSQKMRNILLSVVLTLALVSMVILALTMLGLMPVSADGQHSRLEAKIMPVVLHASIARRAPNEKNPVSLDEDDLKTGVDVYKAMCARCHSTPDGGPSVYGQSFYPPAPQLQGGLPGYTDFQLFWIIKHGIRNTGMPAWGSMLSDEEIWQIVTLLKNSQDLPPSVESEWDRAKSKPHDK